jgi:ribosomal protein S18 acetylase RimI-like enzyme
MAGDEGIEIRRSTLADLTSLTHLHLEAFRPQDHVPVILGRGYLRATYRWQLTDRRAYVLAARIGRRIVGLVSVCDGPYTRPMFLACLPQFAWSLLRHPALAFKRRLWSRLRRRPQGASLPAVVPPSAYLMNVAVAADHRGRGVFGRLSEAARSESKQRGARTIRTGVYRSNTASIRAFTKGGWAELPQEATTHTLAFITYLDEPGGTPGPGQTAGHR